MVMNVPVRPTPALRERERADHYHMGCNTLTHITSSIISMLNIKISNHFQGPFSRGTN